MATGSRYKMISIPAALDTVLAHTPVLGVERVPLQAALGRMLADTVTARDALPPFPASIKVCGVRCAVCCVACRSAAALGTTATGRQRKSP